MGRQLNPIYRRLEYIAQQHRADVLEATVLAVAVAHALHGDAWLLHVNDPNWAFHTLVNGRDAKYAGQSVEGLRKARVLETVKQQFGDQATRYDPMLPWLAAQIAKKQRQLAKAVRKRGPVFKEGVEEAEIGDLAIPYRAYVGDDAFGNKWARAKGRDDGPEAITMDQIASLFRRVKTYTDAHNLDTIIRVSQARLDQNRTARYTDQETNAALRLLRRTGWAITSDIRAYLAAIDIDDLFLLGAWFEAESPDLGDYDLGSAREEAADWSRWMNEAEENKCQPLPESPERYVWPDGWRVVELDTDLATTCDGEVMKFCIDEYEPEIFAHNGGDLRVFSLRDPENRPQATMGFDKEYGEIENHHFRGFANQVPDPMSMARMSEFRRLHPMFGMQAYRWSDGKASEAADFMERQLLGIVEVLDADDDPEEWAVVRHRSGWTLRFYPLDAFIRDYDSFRERKEEEHWSLVYEHDWEPPPELGEREREEWTDVQAMAAFDEMMEASLTEWRTNDAEYTVDNVDWPTWRANELRFLLAVVGVLESMDEVEEASDDDEMVKYMQAYKDADVGDGPEGRRIDRGERRLSATFPANAPFVTGLGLRPEGEYTVSFPTPHGPGYQRVDFPQGSPVSP